MDAAVRLLRERQDCHRKRKSVPHLQADSEAELQDSQERQPPSAPPQPLPVVERRRWASVLSKQAECVLFWRRRRAGCGYGLVDQRNLRHLVGQEKNLQRNRRLSHLGKMCATR